MRLPEGLIVHRSPGRLRIRIRQEQRNTAYFDHIRRKLSEYPRIGEIETTPRTGSLMITGMVPDPAELNRFAGKNRLFHLPENRLPQGRTLPRLIERTIGACNNAIATGTRGELDLFFMIFLFLIGTSTYQLIRDGFKLPPWHTAFWYSMGFFTKSMIEYTDPSEPGGE